ncbi:hypothetical protein FRC96_18950 [Lujinxingia vulgaris]|uniref:Lipoprotein n=1 Tax=Lujinxingia vulgaris TaxID=2600176 RepID=A0A5C6X1G5_9DELT|nr:hypothetical protein [Lujinxingia vulgaris]TXD32075.1 hypothetical protein FRC96_18950 [Lujinxingia vulgaris]
MKLPMHSPWFILSSALLVMTSACHGDELPQEVLHDFCARQIASCYDDAPADFCQGWVARELLTLGELDGREGLACGDAFLDYYACGRDVAACQQDGLLSSTCAPEAAYAVDRCGLDRIAVDYDYAIAFNGRSASN